MDFRFDEEQLALRDAVRAVCERHFSLDSVQSREGQQVSDLTWATLSDVGVFAMLVPATEGGTGGSAVEAALICEEFGLHVANGPLRWTTAVAPLLWATLRPEFDAATLRVAGVDATVSASPHVIEHAFESDYIVVLHADRVELCRTARVGGLVAGAALDPLTPSAWCAELPNGDVVGNATDAQRLRDLGAILAAAELVGAAQGALTTAVEYAKQRHQFGVPIGSFQAVKHMLADMFVRLELARSTVYAAAAIFTDPRAGDVAASVSTAKLLAGEAAIANAKTAVQILGGMGFTWEMLPHYFLKRAWVLEMSFGTADEHALALADLLATAITPSWAREVS